MSYQKPSTSITLTTSGYAVGNPCVVMGVHLAGGSANSTVLVRDGGPGGEVRAKLAAVIGAGDDYHQCFRCKTDCYLEISGAAAVATIAIDMPRANVV